MTLGGRTRTAEPEEILVRARALFRADESKDLRSVIAEKIEELRHYDVLAMDRVAAILMWGRSGSLLLSSYLDGHEDVMLLPETSGQGLYHFFERYQWLPLRDKLIAYAAFDPKNHRLFEGDFAISSAQYYAAVQAILEFYGKWPAEFLESRRAFFLFVHIAYNLALGRRPANPCPLIVYSQHAWDDVVARHLVEDFPRTKFVHTIRDPISSCNGVFHSHFTFAEKHGPARGFLPIIPYIAVCCLTNKDRPHSGMESRTRTVRFEDLHRDSAQIMRDLSGWLGLPYRAALLDSTFNGIPYVVMRDGEAWSGSRLEQIQRRSSHFSLKDRALLFACFYENFVDWDYPCPRIFRHPMVRYLVFVSLCPFPMKMEIIAARAAFRLSVLPWLRHGNILPAIKSLLEIGFCRLKITWRLASVVFRRCFYGTTLLQVDPAGRAVANPRPSAGSTSGGSPGYVLDHTRALEHGGADTPDYMQWQTREEAKAKDKTE